MKNAEHIAITRIIADLIKADAIIDVGEMEMYALLKERYGITRQIERAASETTLAEAVKTMQQSDPRTRREFLQVCADMTVSDGFCDLTEAMIMFALNHTLGKQPDGKVLSIYEPNIRGVLNMKTYTKFQPLVEKLTNPKFWLIFVGIGVWMIVLQNFGVFSKSSCAQSVYVVGGDIDAEVSGSLRVDGGYVTVDGEVDVNDPIHVWVDGGMISTW